ncbi:DNA-binding transcriptional regulator [Fontisphaera persica]|uniref:AraC family transcriptional regulator n=1 Tax=Fontisphaera persica TaxID=2974023 RepID=UPI0024C0D235|nr:DNA-binding transcriptional regulator [Fontisphaera persica]WCJ58332.1 DNA-binding transcriptional regulator [Fontisphaera persica]
MHRLYRVLLLIESSRASGRSLLRGIAGFARHHGRWLCHWETGGLEKAWPHLRTFQADGIIMRDVDRVEEAMEYHVPLVVVGHSRHEVPGVVNLVSNSETIGRLGAEHLLNCGLKHLAFYGLSGVPWSEERAASFSARVAAAGLAAHHYQTPPGTSGEDERRGLAEWLLRLPHPVGIMACNDDHGQQVIEAAKLAGLRLPDEVAVLGVDNDELVCELSSPPMSSVAVNFERAGYESAQLLDRLMRGQQPSTNRIVAQAVGVITRQSTDILAVQDPRLAAALRFIRTHADAPLTVSEVARAAGMSRRALEKQFRALLDRSIRREIARVRVERICRLLEETNRPISHIAEAMGFQGQEHFARYFRAEKGMTPLAYRRKFARW